MSEFINNISQKKDKIKTALKRIHDGEAYEDVKQEFADVLGTATAQEISEIEQTLIEEGMPVENIQYLCDVHVAMFRESLDKQPPPEMMSGHPIYTFRAENELLAFVLNAAKQTLNKLKEDQSEVLAQKLKGSIEKLKQFDTHYLRKENILFPYLEKTNFSGPSSVMWGIHDDIRKGWRLPEENWLAIHSQEPDFGYSYVTRGTDWPIESEKKEPVNQLKKEEKEERKETMTQFPLTTGDLSISQINMLLTHLPVDITYVDENDTVLFFSETADRIFKRTAAIIGRKVQNCHPPQSMNKVQKILDDFKAGTRDTAEFWIQMNGMFIHIRYFALHDANGNYKGTLEVSQDLTHLRALEGEKRLLND